MKTYFGENGSQKAEKQHIGLFRWLNAFDRNLLNIRIQIKMKIERTLDKRITGLLLMLIIAMLGFMGQSTVFASVQSDESIGLEVAEGATLSASESNALKANSSCPIVMNQYVQNAKYAPLVTAIPASPSNFYSNMSSTNGTPNNRANYSGVTHDIVSNTTLIVDDLENVIDVYDYNNMFVKSIDVNFTTDLEDIVWMNGNSKYALLDEATSMIHVVNITSNTTQLNTSDILYTINTCIPPIQYGGGNPDGFEGLSFDFQSDGTNAEFFYLSWEGRYKGKNSPKIYEFRRYRDNDNNPTNNVVRQFGPLNLRPIMRDTAAVHFQSLGSPNFPLGYGDYGNLYVLSHLNKRVYQIDSFYSGKVIATYSVSNFTKPQGFAFSLLMDKMYVVGESDQLGTYTIQ